MAEDNKPATMSEAVKDKYRMKPAFAPGLYNHLGVFIDTSKCTLEELETALKNGLDVVEAIPATKPSSKP